MKTLLTLTLVLGSALAGPFVMASPLADVPTGHWAAGAVRRLAAEKIMTGGVHGEFQGDKPVTRYELALTLDRLVHYIEAGRKPLNPHKAQGAVKIPASADAATRKALTFLAKGGFIPADSPLLQGNKVVTAHELTTILSQVAVAVSDRSLPPTPH